MIFICKSGLLTGLSLRDTEEHSVHILPCPVDTLERDLASIGSGCLTFSGSRRNWNDGVGIGGGGGR